MPRKDSDHSYYLKNRRRILARNKEWALRHPEQTREYARRSRIRRVKQRRRYNKAYNAAHREERNAYNRKRMKRWRAENAELHRATNKLWRIEHPEYVRTYSREWARRNYAINPEPARARTRRWRAKNSERFHLIQRRLYRKHRIKRLADAKAAYDKRRLDPDAWKHYLKKYGCYVKKRLKKDVQFRLSRSLRARVRMAIKATAKAIKCDSAMRLIGCSIEDFKFHIEALWESGMSWNNWGVHGWHIDHIRPCCTFDLTKPSEQKKCFHWSNTRPLWGNLNSSKGAEFSHHRQWA